MSNANHRPWWECPSMLTSVPYQSGSRHVIVGNHAKAVKYAVRVHAQFIARDLSSCSVDNP